MRCKVCGHTHEGSCLDCPDCLSELDDDETFVRLCALEERVAEIEEHVVPLLLQKKKRRDYMRQYMRDYRGKSGETRHGPSDSLPEGPP